MNVRESYSHALEQGALLLNHRPNLFVYPLFCTDLSKHQPQHCCFCPNPLTCFLFTNLGFRVLPGDFGAGPRHLLGAGLRPEGERGAHPHARPREPARSHDLPR